jgi:hypothetical protein
MGHQLRNGCRSVRDEIRLAYLSQFVNERIQNELAGYGDQAYIFHEALNAAPCRLDLGTN